MKSRWILFAAWIVSVGSAVEASESKVSASDSAEALVRAFAQEKGLPGMAAAVGTVGGSVLLRIYPDDGVVISLLGNLSMVGDDRFGDIPDQLFALFQNK